MILLFSSLIFFIQAEDSSSLNKIVINIYIEETDKMINELSKKLAETDDILSNDCIMFDINVYSNDNLIVIITKEDYLYYKGLDILDKSDYLIKLIYGDTTNYIKNKKTMNSWLNKNIE
jgi:hypothetical protein